MSAGLLGSTPAVCLSERQFLPVGQNRDDRSVGDLAVTIRPNSRGTEPELRTGCAFSSFDCAVWAGGGDSPPFVKTFLQ